MPMHCFSSSIKTRISTKTTNFAVASQPVEAELPSYQPPATTPCSTSDKKLTERTHGQQATALPTSKSSVARPMGPPENESRQTPPPSQRPSTWPPPPCQQNRLLCTPPL